ncbi:MAG: helix-turn-helix domain-containing protein [Prevotella sp.]|nr:helix-turn-helix domain-containing protein [Prevotella sp.]
MVNEEPVVSLSARYTIAQTAKLLGMSRNTIRKYTEIGELKSITHKSTGKTLYEGISILKFWRTKA